MTQFTLLIESPGQARDRRGRWAHGNPGVAGVGADVSHQGGGTYEPASLKKITTGTVVGRPGHSASFEAAQFKMDPAYRKTVILAYLHDNKAEFAKGGKFGVWDSTSEGGHTVVFDVVDVTTRAKGIKLGKSRGEDGVYDLDAPPGTGYIATGGSNYTPG